MQSNGIALNFSHANIQSLCIPLLGIMGVFLEYTHLQTCKSPCLPGKPLDCFPGKQRENRGLYCAPLFHMDSMWNPCGIHIIPSGFHQFHMEYVLAGIPLILVIPFQLHSIWIPCGMAIFHPYSIIPYVMSTWNSDGIIVFHMDFISFHGIEIYSTWIPYGRKY
jgi:hypothetical protein